MTSLSRLGGQNGYQGTTGQGIPLYAGPFWLFGLAALIGLVAWRIKFSGWGRALRALREDEIAAAAVGRRPDELQGHLVRHLRGGRGHRGRRDGDHA